MTPTLQHIYDRNLGILSLHVRFMQGLAEHNPLPSLFSTFMHQFSILYIQIDTSSLQILYIPALSVTPSPPPPPRSLHTNSKHHPPRPLHISYK